MIFPLSHANEFHVSLFQPEDVACIYLTMDQWLYFQVGQRAADLDHAPRNVSLKEGDVFGVLDLDSAI